MTSYLPPSGARISTRKKGRKRRNGQAVTLAVCLLALSVALGLFFARAVREARRVHDGEITVAQMLSSLGDWLLGRSDEPPSDGQGQQTDPAKRPDEMPMQSEPDWEKLYAFDAAVLAPGEIGIRPVDLWTENGDTTNAGAFEALSGNGMAVNGPLVLIVHSHTGEAYTEPGVDRYLPGQTVGRSERPERCVAGVGQVLADELERQGVECLTVQTAFDAGGNAGAFDRAAEEVAACLEQYPSIRLVVDVHRGAKTDAAGHVLRAVTYDEGQEAAQIKLMASFRDRDRALASECGRLLNDRARHLCYAAESINMGENWEYKDVSVLRIEIGTAGNTPAQAHVSTRALAEVLAACIK